MIGPTIYDVFLSSTRIGHPDLTRTIRKLLRKADISVFMDEDVPAGESISPQIADALNASRIMLVVYSASYNERWARLGPPPVQPSAVAARREPWSRLLPESPADPVLIGIARPGRLRGSRRPGSGPAARAAGGRVLRAGRRPGPSRGSAAPDGRVRSVPGGRPDRGGARLPGQRRVPPRHRACSSRPRPGLSGDLAIQARWELAAGLDGLGRSAEANDLWAGLAGASWDPELPSGSRSAARAMLARGRLAGARSILDDVLNGPDPAHADQLNVARFKMAGCCCGPAGSGRAGRWPHRS